MCMNKTVPKSLPHVATATANSIINVTAMKSLHRTPTTQIPKNDVTRNSSSQNGW